jgi:hypothetical protein
MDYFEADDLEKEPTSSMWEEAKNKRIKEK